MAQLPGRFALHLTALLLGLALAPSASAVGLEGTWHVLVHYQDANSGSPEQMRWHDRIWVFERKGSRVKWTEYPIVVFSSDNGRFERRASGQYARVLGAWEPNDSQLGNIKGGLKINSRGSKKKSLRGSDAEGWRSTARARPGSASIVTYQENWSIESWADLPLFLQEDVMSSARTESMEGMTSYETTAVEAGGDVLVGNYERDGTRKGAFRMTRSGAVGQLDNKSQRELQEQAYQRSLASSQETRRQAFEQVNAAADGLGMKLTEDQKEKLVQKAGRLLSQGVDADRVRRQIEQDLRENAPDAP